MWHKNYLRNGIVRGEGGLKSFLATNTHTNMCSLQGFIKNLQSQKTQPNSLLTPSHPLTPPASYPTCIMLTSLAPSPMASVMESFTLLFTSLTTSAFCTGDTLQNRRREG